MKQVLLLDEEEALPYLEDLIQRAVHQAVKELKALEKAPPKEEDNWVDGPEAMQILGIKSKTTLQDLRDVMAITYSQPSKKVIRYYKPSLLKYLENHIVKY